MCLVSRAGLTWLRLVQIAVSCVAAGSVGQFSQLCGGHSVMLVTPQRMSTGVGKPCPLCTGDSSSVNGRASVGVRWWFPATLSHKDFGT